MLYDATLCYIIVYNMCYSILKRALLYYTRGALQHLGARGAARGDAAGCLAELL